MKKSRVKRIEIQKTKRKRVYEMKIQFFHQYFRCRGWSHQALQNTSLQRTSSGISEDYAVWILASRHLASHGIHLLFRYRARYASRSPEESREAGSNEEHTGGESGRLPREHGWSYRPDAARRDRKEVGQVTGAATREVREAAAEADRSWPQETRR